ncbi:MAG: SusC/RagA family TonB-linked outer membrane protein, partial [Prevotellaceae bacterium]|nr:SusC/RagA family TonB-linked outer membrane protein [Prevotellaceae bacterium]
EKAVITVEAKWGNSRRGVPNYNVMTDPAMYYETLYQSLYNARIYNGMNASDAYAYADANIFGNAGAGYQMYTIPYGERFMGTNFKINPNAVLGYQQGDFYYYPDNWEKNSLRTDNLRQEYSVQIAGGGQQASYFLSAGYLDDPGLVNGSGFERYTLRGKVDAQVTDWLKAGANISYALSNYKNPDSQTSWGSTGNVFYTMNTMAPIYPFFVRNADGSLRIDNNGWHVYDTGSNTDFLRGGGAPRGNNAINLLLDENYDYTDYINSNFYVTLQPIKELQITARVAPAVSNDRSMSSSNMFYGSPTVDGMVSVEHLRRFIVNQQYLADFKTTIAESHHLQVLAGFENYIMKLQSLSGRNSFMYSPFIYELDNCFGAEPTNLNVGSSTENYATAGFLGRLQYDYDMKYIFNASLRHEGSSRFGPTKRWGTFWSVGGAWLITKEDFMVSTANWLDELKLKASYGTQGNEQIGNYYAWRDMYLITYNNETGEYSKTLSIVGNSALTWEAQKLFNVGVEFSTFEQRFSGGVDFFVRTNTDMLFNLPMPLSAGFASFPTNIGSVRASGIEIDLNGEIFRTDKILWTVAANITHVKSKILDLPEIYKINGGIKGSSSIYKVGGSLTQGWMQRYAGVDPTTGQALYYLDPENGDFTETTDYSIAKQTDVGDLSPDLYGGLSTNIEYDFGYGTFDLGIQFTYQLGGKAYDGTYQELMHTGKQGGRNWHMDILNAWTPTNPSATIPRIASSDDNDQQVSDRWLTSTSFLSLNNITLGYTLPKSVTKILQISKARLYVSGDNLWMLSARKGFDPRQSQNALGRGVGISTTSGNYIYSQMRVLSGGILITF